MTKGDEFFFFFFNSKLLDKPEIFFSFDVLADALFCSKFAIEQIAFNESNFIHKLCFNNKTRNFRRSVRFSHSSFLHKIYCTGCVFVVNVRLRDDVKDVIQSTQGAGAFDFYFYSLRLSLPFPFLPAASFLHFSLFLSSLL